VAVALPAVMGWRVSRGARFAQASVVAQGLGWAAFLAARPFGDRFFSTLWIGCLGLSFAFMWHAMRHWVGPRRGARLVTALAVATPSGYGRGCGNNAFRVGWSNMGLAALMLAVCAVLLAPAAGVSRRWRGLAVVCLAALAGVTLWRGVLGAFFTAAYPQLRWPHPANVTGALLGHVALVLVTFAVLVAWREEAERELKRLAETDGLTGLLNRQAFMQRAEGALAWGRRYGESLSLLLIDLDHFKRINDLGGHAAGDQALRRFADCLRGCLRRGDLACRYGGEEFAVLLWHADAQAAQAFDARLRAALAPADAASARLDFSAGLMALREPQEPLERCLQQVDAALYRAKAAGRGRLEQAST
jgi:diguanylate cyclase (GGDEF)-like protein